MPANKSVPDRVRSRPLRDGVISLGFALYHLFFLYPEYRMFRIYRVGDTPDWPHVLDWLPVMFVIALAFAFAISALRFGGRAAYAVAGVSLTVTCVGLYLLLVGAWRVLWLI